MNWILKRIAKMSNAIDEVVVLFFSWLFDIVKMEAIINNEQYISGTHKWLYWWIGSKRAVVKIKDMPIKTVDFRIKNTSKSENENINVIALAFRRLIPNSLKKGNKKNENKGDFKKLSQSNKLNWLWWIKFLIWQVFNPSSDHAPLLPEAILKSASEVKNKIWESEKNTKTIIKRIGLIPILYFVLFNK